MHEIFDASDSLFSELMYFCVLRSRFIILYFLDPRVKTCRMSKPARRSEHERSCSADMEMVPIHFPSSFSAATASHKQMAAIAKNVESST